VIRLAVRVRREDAERVLAELLELAPAGVEEVHTDGAVEYAVYGAPGELPGLPDLDAVAGDALVSISTSEVADDWAERWREFHKPILIDAPSAPEPAVRIPALHIRPPWLSPSGLGSDVVREIVIDPAQAFGTGAHATTRLCLELLLALAAEQAQRGALLDVGTGSGVLAIAAAMLGFEPVLALDNDPESVRAASQNASFNGAAVEVRRLDLRAEALPWLDARRPRAAPLTVAANLLRPLLLELAGAVRCPPDHLIAGGLLSGEAEEVSRAFAAKLGMRERERRGRGEWAALWLSAPA